MDLLHNIIMTPILAIMATGSSTPGALQALWHIVSTPQNLPFVSLFIFRYTRLLVHLVSYFLYRPSPILEAPHLTEKDCTVIIPTCAPEDSAFSRCIDSVVQTSPKVIHIVCVGVEQEKNVWLTIAPFVGRLPGIQFKVSHSTQANKRRQVAVAVRAVKTTITVLCDDHVVWPSANLLRAAVAPFEDIFVGGVGTNKRVVRFTNTGLWQGWFNVLGALYLERHNFEHTASNAIDGGVAVISGRTALYRTHILQGPKFLDGYLNEMFFFGIFGPLAADDDNYLTRQLVKQGWKIKFQNHPDAMIVCEVGTYPKFLSQCLRWARTTFRSNMCSLVTDRSVYKQPWAVYALQVSLMINFALFYDAALLYTLTRTDFSSTQAFKMMALWIALTKLPKISPYFWRNPTDLFYLPGYYLFAYYHSLIKLWALLTFWNCEWSGRDLAAVDAAAAERGDDDEQPPVDFMDFEEPLTPQPEPECPPQRVQSCRSAQRPVSTPWGQVKPQSYCAPANILATSQAGRSWPSSRDATKAKAYRIFDRENIKSPRALEFEECLARQAYPTPVSTLVHRSGNAYLTAYSTGFTPAAVRAAPTPTVRADHSPSVPSCKWKRFDEYGQVHEGPHPVSVVATEQNAWKQG
jgi:cellulose synthase/poly-beta-1,6-N-acetylglucosamine synthase-like glycosyltransferase